MKTSDAVAYYNNLYNTERRPIYKIELLRDDETSYKTLEGYVSDGNGSCNSTRQNGTRNVCSFSIANYNGLFNEFANSLSIGAKFKLFLGEVVNDTPIYFSKGVYLYQNPTFSSSDTEDIISISGVDKWSLLNGTHGGILEGTYVVEANSTYGDFIRKTINLDIVNDPIQPNISPELENQVITYDIVKTTGANVADIIIDVAVNIGAEVFYDDNGRFTTIPLEEDCYKSLAYDFSNDADITFLSSSRVADIENIYNAVLVATDKTDSSNNLLIKELLNEDESDINSIPNCGRKKLYVVTDYLNGITSQALCDARAVYELRKIQRKYSTISETCASILYLSVGDVIRERTDKTKYSIASISRNIGTDLTTTLSVSTFTNL